MKCLTIHQPWAELIRRRDKRVENRFWGTNYRGLIAIHAGKSQSRLDQCDQFGINPKAVAFGAIVAVARLETCLELDTLRTAGIPGYEWVLTHPFTEGPHCWCLGPHTMPVDPEIKLRGQQGLFDLPQELSELLTARWESHFRELRIQEPTRAIALED